MRTHRLRQTVVGQRRSRNPFPLWRASSFALPAGFTFTRSGNGTVFEGATFAGRRVVTKSTDVPRFEVLSGDRQGLLLEGARTALPVQASTFNHASWAKTRATVSADAVVSLGGSSTGDALIEDNTASNTHFIALAVTQAANTLATYSVWAKRVSGSRNLRINVVSGANQLQGTFDLGAVTAAHATTGDAGSASSGIVAYPNGWYRCWVSGIASVATANPSFRLHLLSGATESYSGDNASSLGLWNAMVEAGGFPAAAISTTSASVTRNAETCSRPVTLPSGGFTAVVEFVASANTAAQQFIHQIWQASAYEYDLIREANGNITLELYKAGSASPLDFGVLAAGERGRVAYSVTASRVAASMNGGSVQSAAADRLNVGAMYEALGSRYGGGDWSFGHILACNASPTVWRPPVTDAELQALSTLT